MQNAPANVGSEPRKIIFLVPVHDDWESLEKLIKITVAEFADSDLLLEILVIDDGSPRSFAESGMTLSALPAISKVSVLELKRNLGHQRAIALGLTYIEENIPGDIVLIMDGDGEDKPSEAKGLIEKCYAENLSKIVFGRRAKRSENLQFRLFYQFYKTVFKFLTGKEIRFGNFSAVPTKFLSKLVTISEIWNHYAAAIARSRIPYTEIATVRGNRLDGSSKMNFVSLVIHGLSAISVYGEVIGVRLLLLTVGMTVVSVFFIGVVLAVRLLTEVAIPGWATYTIVLLIVVLLQFVTLSLFFSFIVLTGRSNATFLPQRDYHHFISRIFEIYGSSRSKLQEPNHDLQKEESFQKTVSND